MPGRWGRLVQNLFALAPICTRRRASHLITPSLRQNYILYVQDKKPYTCVNRLLLYNHVAKLKTSSNDAASSSPLQNNKQEEQRYNNSNNDEQQHNKNNQQQTRASNMFKYFALLIASNAAIIYDDPPTVAAQTTFRGLHNDQQPYILSRRRTSCSGQERVNENNNGEEEEEKEEFYGANQYAGYFDNDPPPVPPVVCGTVRHNKDYLAEIGFKDIERIVLDRGFINWVKIELMINIFGNHIREPVKEEVIKNYNDDFGELLSENNNPFTQETVDAYKNRCNWDPWNPDNEAEHARFEKWVDKIKTTYRNDFRTVRDCLGTFTDATKWTESENNRGAWEIARIYVDKHSNRTDGGLEPFDTVELIKYKTKRCAVGPGERRILQEIKEYRNTNQHKGKRSRRNEQVTDLYFLLETRLKAMHNQVEQDFKPIVDQIRKVLDATDLFELTQDPEFTLFND